jgi:hypothetical protein
MNRRFVNLLVDQCPSPRPAFNLHRIDPRSLFYPAGSPKPAEITESAPAPRPRSLPSASMSFDWPCKRHQTGWMDFMAFKNSIVAVDHEALIPTRMMMIATLTLMMMMLAISHADHGDDQCTRSRSVAGMARRCASVRVCSAPAVCVRAWRG